MCGGWPSTSVYSGWFSLLLCSSVGQTVDVKAPHMEHPEYLLSKEARIPKMFFCSSELALSPDLAFSYCRFPASRNVILRKPQCSFLSTQVLWLQKGINDWRLRDMLALYRQMTIPAVFDQRNTTSLCQPLKTYKGLHSIHISFPHEI